MPPRRTLQTRPALFSCPRGSRRPGSSWAPGSRMGCCLQSQWPQVSSQRPREAAPSFAPAGERSRAPSEEGGGGGRGGEGMGAGGGGPGGGGAGVRGLRATFLQTTLPHAESTEISEALEGIASGRAGGSRGTTQVSPCPRPSRGRGGRRGSRSPTPRDPQGGSLESHTLNR